MEEEEKEEEEEACGRVLASSVRNARTVSGRTRRGGGFSLCMLSPLALVCVCVCARARARACVRACVRVCMSAYVRERD